MTTSKPKKNRWQVLTPASASFKVLVELAPKDIAMFRFLLEGYDNLANFTVLERSGLLKVSSSPHQQAKLLQSLREIQHSLPLKIKTWPKPDAALLATQQPSE